MLILGIDDAGRGPLIGPMILAGVLIDKNGEGFLRKYGITDEKIVVPRDLKHVKECEKFLAILDGSKTFYFGQTCNSYQLPKGGANVYLELNYKCNQKFVAGITSYSSSGFQIQQSPLITINKSDDWNKLYINLTDEVSAVYNVSADNFKFFFSMVKESGVSVSELYLDNIKLIH